MREKWKWRMVARSLPFLPGVEHRLLVALQLALSEEGVDELRISKERLQAAAGIARTHHTTALRALVSLGIVRIVEDFAPRRARVLAIDYDGIRRFVERRRGIHHPSYRSRKDAAP